MIEGKDDAVVGATRSEATKIVKREREERRDTEKGRKDRSVIVT